MRKCNLLIGVLAVLMLPKVLVPATLTGHPRLLLDPARLRLVKLKAAAGDPDWRELRARADKLLSSPVQPYCRSRCAEGITYPYQGAGWFEAIQTLALVYQVTSRTNYADKVIEILNAANAPLQAGSLEPISADSGYPSRSATFALALAYDWVYDRLGEATKTATINTLNAWYDWYKKGAYQRTGPAYGNYFGGHVLGFGAAGLATAGDNPRADEITAYMRGLFDNSVPAAFRSGGFQGGYPVESYNYGTSHFIRLFQYMQAVKSATGEDLGITKYGRPVAVNLLYNLKPNRWQVTDEGDFPGDTTGILGASLPLVMASLLSGTPEGAWIEFFYRNLGSPPSSVGSNRPGAFFRVLYADASRPAVDYRLILPTRYRSPGDEHIYVRSSWRDDAVWASFAAGGARFVDHESRKAGHLAIQRGDDYLLVNSGQWKGKNGLTGRPEAFDLASWRTNTLFFDDSNEYLKIGAQNRGGQNLGGSNKILAFENGPDFLYVKSDFTSVYDRMESRDDDRRSLRLFERSFLYLEPNLFVVFDRVRTRRDTYFAKLFFHFNPNGVPVVTDNLTTSTVGNSTLFQRTLFPKVPVIRVEPDPVSDKNPAPVTYRAEVSDSHAGTDLVSLQVISVAGKGSSFLGAEAIEAAEGKEVGALITERIGYRLVMLARDGSSPKEFNYELRASKGSTIRHLLVDLSPGGYTVFQDGTQVISRQPVSSQGVLAFKSTGGGTFRVTGDPN